MMYELAATAPSAINDEAKERILNDLDMLMKKEKVFSQPQLSLSGLAEMLETNTTYLSKVINEHFNTNFSTYLNNFRIREAQKMFANKQHKSMTLEGIAQSVGFHSRSSFNAAFRKFSGITPTLFIKNLHILSKTKKTEGILQNN
jgi:YesN/AraC family two-component response regulator